jgi:membrane fusion protein, multidrug efflux system
MGAPEPTVIPISQPVLREGTDFVEFTGRVNAVQTVNVIPRVTGYLVQMPFEEGAEVKTGDLLFEIDPRPYKAQLDQALGQVEVYKAQLQLAEVTLARDMALQNNRGVITQQQIDQDRAAMEEARARVKAYEAITVFYRLNVDFTKVHSPIDGMIGRHFMTVGNLVNQDQTLLATVVSLDPIYIYFDVDEATYLKNNRLWFEGRRPSSRDTPNPVQVTLTGETKPSHDGKMDFIDNRLDLSTGTLRSRAVIPNKDLSILPGQFGRVRLIGSAPYEALLLPDTAIATDQSRKIVFVVKDDNTVEAKPVTLGPLDEGLRVIREGLKAEDRVIVDGLQRARVGAKVSPHPAPAAAKSGDKT